MVALPSGVRQGSINWLPLQVMAGWRLFMDGHGKPRHLHLEDLRIHVYDSSAFITCTEIVEFADSRGRYQLCVALFVYLGGFFQLYTRLCNSMCCI